MSSGRPQAGLEHRKPSHSSPAAVRRTLSFIKIRSLVLVGTYQDSEGRSGCHGCSGSILALARGLERDLDLGFFGPVSPPVGQPLADDAGDSLLHALAVADA